MSESKFNVGQRVANAHYAEETRGEWAPCASGWSGSVPVHSSARCPPSSASVSSSWFAGQSV